MLYKLYSGCRSLCQWTRWTHHLLGLSSFLNLAKTATNSSLLLNDHSGKPSLSYWLLRLLRIASDPHTQIAALSYILAASSCVANHPRCTAYSRLHRDESHLQIFSLEQSDPRDHFAVLVRHRIPSDHLPKPMYTRAPPLSGWAPAPADTTEPAATLHRISICGCQSGRQ